MMETDGFLAHTIELMCIYNWRCRSLLEKKTVLCVTNATAQCVSSDLIYVTKSTANRGVTTEIF